MNSNKDPAMSFSLNRLNAVETLVRIREVQFQLRRIKVQA